MENQTEKEVYASVSKKAEDYVPTNAELSALQLKQ